MILEELITLLEDEKPWYKTLNHDLSFEELINIGKENCKDYAEGSGRIAFFLEDGTVLKIPKNEKGLYQNKVECKVLGSHTSKYVIPLIECDGSDFPLWIRTKKAEPVKKEDFEKVIGCNAKDFKYALYKLRKHKKGQYFTNKKVLDNPILKDIAKLTKKYDLSLAEMSRAPNWGVYEGKPVLIDLGLSREVFKRFYEEDKKKNESR